LIRWEDACQLRTQSGPVGHAGGRVNGGGRVVPFPNRCSFGLYVPSDGLRLHAIRVARMRTNERRPLSELAAMVVMACEVE
jgi:hypothetical protein